MKSSLFSKELLSDQVLSGTVIVAVGVFIGSIFSYLLQLALGRLLTIDDFGTFNALLSFSVVLTVLHSALATSLVKTVSELKANARFDTLTHLFRNLTFYFFCLGLVTFLGLYLVRTQLAAFLHVDDLSLLVLLGVLMGLSFLAIMPVSYLQGLSRFKAFAFWTVLRNVIRFAIPTIFVLLGFGVQGVLGGINLSIIVSFLVALLLLRKNFRKIGATDLNGYYRKILIFTGPVIFVQISMTILNNIDVILVKHFFDATSAGLYSGVVTVGKVLLFGAGTVGVVMFPQISEAFAKGEDYVEKFKPFLYLQVLITVCGVLVFSLFPKIIVGVMFGEKYLSAVAYVPRFSVFMGLYVLVNFLVTFFLAIEKLKVVFFQVPAIAIQLLLIVLFHSSINQVINVNIFVSLILFVCIMLYYLADASFHNSASL